MAMADRTKSLEGASAPAAIRREGETSTTARPPPPQASSEENGGWSSPTHGLLKAVDEHFREIQSLTVANGNRSTEAVNNTPDLAGELVAAKRRISQLTADVDPRIVQAAESEDRIRNLEQQIHDRNDQVLSLQRENVQAKCQAQSSGEKPDALETDNARLQNLLELQQRHASEALGRPSDGHGPGKQPPSAHNNEANGTSAVPVVGVSQETARSTSFNRTLPDYIDLTSLPFELHTKLPKVVFHHSPRHVASLNEATTAKARSLAADMLRTVNESTLNKLRTPNSISTNGCMYSYLKATASSIWTKEHRRLYACKTCVNTQRLCMSMVDGLIVILPIHPELRIPTADGDNDVEMLGDDRDVGAVSSLEKWIAPTAFKARGKHVTIY